MRTEKTTITETMAPSAKRVKFADGTVAWQPQLSVVGAFGKVTHSARGVYLLHKADAMAAAKNWASESRECGYIR